MTKILFGTAVISFLVSQICYAGVPREIESKYSEAVLSYHSKKYDDTLRILNSALQTHPKLVALLELKGLTLKAKGEWDSAYTTYRTLVDISKGEKAPEASRAPYYFEMGMVKFRQNKFREAIPALEYSLRQNFNVAPSHYALGVSMMNEKKIPEAENHFYQVLQSDIGELKPPTHLSLAQINGIGGDTRGAIRETIRARLLASAALQTESSSSDARPMAQQVMASSEKFLKDLDRNTLQVSVGLGSGYDSNVLLVPTTTANSVAGGTNQSSVTTTAQWDAAYASTPVANEQWSASYAGSINYNLNQQTRAGEYFSHTLTAQYARDMNLPVGYGLRLVSLFNMRFGDDNSPTPNAFYTYNTTVSFGPFMRVEYKPRQIIGVEAFVNGQYYFQDSSSDAAYRLSGLGLQSRIFWQQLTNSTMWNPMISASLIATVPSGSEFRSKGVSLSAQNTFRVGDKLRVIPSATGAYTFYSERSDGERRDATLAGGLAAQYSLTRNWLISGSANYTLNLSSVEDTYAYNRLAGGVNVQYYF